jgi:hypothetical protein
VREGTVDFQGQGAWNCINCESDTLRVAGLFAAMTNQQPDLQLHLRQAMTGEVADRLDKGVKGKLTG